MHYTNIQLTSLVILRVLIGWQLLYEGVVKLLNPEWSSAGYLNDSQGIFSGFASWMIANPAVTQIVDYLNIWLLIIIGICLIAGLLSRMFSLTAVILLTLYYLSNPPLFSLSGAIISEGYSLIVNKTLIEAAALLIIYLFPSSSIIGLDRFIFTEKVKAINDSN